MKTLISKLNRGPVQHQFGRRQTGAGFVILFAVTLTAILLTISLGVADIALQENKFASSARDANDAFFAADTGIECALFFDKPPTAFPVPASAIPVACAAATPTSTTVGNTVTYSFNITGLGSNDTSCAKVTVKKDGDISPPYILTTVVSKGYNVGSNGNNCDTSNALERELKVTY